MKINLLNNKSPYLSGYLEAHGDSQAFKKRTNAGLCDKKNTTRGYNVNFSGNPAQKASEVAAKNLGDKILNSKTFGSILDYAEAHPISCNALFSLVLAGMLRPATIMALPGNDKSKEDKRNAAAHSVASGIIGFISATIIMSPFDAAMKKVKSDPAKFLGISKKAESYLGNLKAKGLAKTAKFKNVETLMKMGPDIIIGIPRSIITIALIPPILKYVFGIEKKPKGQNPAEQVRQEQNIQDTDKQFANASLSSSAFSAVKGGVK